MPPPSPTSAPVPPDPLERLRNDTTHYSMQTQTPSNLLVSSAFIIFSHVYQQDIGRLAHLSVKYLIETVEMYIY